MAKKFSFEKVKRHPTEREEMFVSHISEVMWIHNNELLHVNNKKISYPIKKKLRADMPIKQLEAETEAHAWQASMKVFFFSFF